MGVGPSRNTSPRRGSVPYESRRLRLMRRPRAWNSAEFPKPIATEASRRKFCTISRSPPHAGTVTALLGRSGCGKTTLLNLAGAMDFPTSGEVLIGGRATGSLNDAELTALRRTRVGFVFQSFQLLPTLTVLENVELPLLLARAPKSARDGARPPALGGSRREGREPSLSTLRRTDAARGDRPRAGPLARNRSSPTSPPAIWIPPAARRFWPCCALSADEFGAAVLMATHSAEAAAIADVRVKLRDGRIVVDRHEAAAHADSAAAGARPAAHGADRARGRAGRGRGGRDRSGGRRRHGVVPLVA